MDTKNMQDKKRKESCSRKYMSGEILAILPAYNEEVSIGSLVLQIRQKYPKIVGPILAGEADMVNWSQYLNGNKKISQLITDPQTRYRAFSRRFFGYLCIEDSNFGAAAGLNGIEMPTGSNGSNNSHLKIKKNINTMVAMPAWEE